ncbi:MULTISPECIES: DUF1272 domain-containing protein [unclassified Bacillus (in: firmicutes)]|uniref:DUF1272 domain-containing protein n=1 Tax=unclassified Bacillus (in: firmicutes) TaxID=185979 RepID=UPI0008ED2B6B|nr:MULTISPECIES: DUF1272 domain-containing protein [unclassified Bacillus (in: firmicutes)]SFQ61322.1 hypothetical protein SAMN04488577_0470 [Bacillus sp. cl95]
MALEMRKECERCNSSIDENSVAYICVHECTFCTPCYEELNSVCPNCGGELVRRPKKPQNVCTL